MIKKYIWVIIAFVLIVGTATFSYATFKKSDEVNIINVWWNVSEMNGQKIVHPERFRLLFDEMGKVGGKSGCNSFGGGYMHKEENFKMIPPFISTKMACFPESAMQEENIFFQTIEKINTLEIIDENTLFLKGTEGKSLRLIKEVKVKSEE